jgi:hypothetical protein
MPMKNPVTPPGIDPGTVRLVAQRLNHYATSNRISRENQYTDFVFNICLPRDNVEKYDRIRQATDGDAVYPLGMLGNLTPQTHTQNVKYLLLSDCKNICTNVAECNVYTYIACLVVMYGEMYCGTVFTFRQ